MANQKQTADEAVYTKEQIVGSQRFAKNRDVIAALLQDEKSYSIGEVETIVSTFLKKEVK